MLWISSTFQVQLHDINKLHTCFHNTGEVRVSSPEVVFLIKHCLRHLCAKTFSHFHPPLKNHKAKFNQTSHRWKGFRFVQMKGWRFSSNINNHLTRKAETWKFPFCYDLQNQSEATGEIYIGINRIIPNFVKMVFSRSTRTYLIWQITVHSKHTLNYNKDSFSLLHHNSQEPGRGYYKPRFICLQEIFVKFTGTLLSRIVLSVKQPFSVFCICL